MKPLNQQSPDFFKDSINANQSFISIRYYYIRKIDNGSLIVDIFSSIHPIFHPVTENILHPFFNTLDYTIKL